MAVLAVGLSAANVAAAQGEADLQLTKISNQKTVKIGETITYTITRPRTSCSEIRSRIS